MERSGVKRFGAERRVRIFGGVVMLVVVVILVWSPFSTCLSLPFCLSPSRQLTSWPKHGCQFIEHCSTLRDHLGAGVGEGQTLQGRLRTRNVYDQRVCQWATFHFEDFHYAGFHEGISSEAVDSLGGEG